MRSHTIIRQNSYLDTNFTWTVIYCVSKVVRLILFDLRQQYVGGRWVLFDYALVVLDPFCRQPRKSPNSYV